MTDGPSESASDAGSPPTGDTTAPGESPVFALSFDAPAPEPATQPQPEPAAQTEPGPLTEAESVVEAAPETVAEPAPETEPETQSAAEPEPEPEPEPAAEPEPTAEPETSAETTQPIPVVAPEAAPAAEAAAVTASPVTASPVTDSPVAVVAPAVPASHAAKKRRRWPWITLLSILLALALIAGAALWYISGLVGAGMAVPQPTEPFPMTVLSTDDSTISYSGTPGGWDDQGLMAIATAEGGYVQTKSPTEVGEGATTTTTRQITAQVLPPTPAAGQPAALDGWYFPRNPLIGLGVDYQDVLYPGPAGPTPAWFIPGTSSTWVIFTHGRGAAPREGLRIASTVTKLGYPMMLINYRDDAKAPAEDGLGNWGVNEWPDLEAAVKYALDHGATKVVLAGASMGAAITLSFLQNSPLASSVVGTFLDSPNVNFGAIVESGAAGMGIPAFVTAAAMQVASWRYGVDWPAADYSEMAASLTTPTLMVQGTEDSRVPVASVEAFAKAANPTIVKLELFEGAGHVLSWNVDRDRYDSLLSGLLTDVAKG